MGQAVTRLWARARRALGLERTQNASRIGLLEHALDPVFLADANGQVLQVNAAARALGPVTATIGASLAAHLPDASAAIYRLSRQVQSDIAAQEVIDTPTETLTLSVHEAADAHLWTLRRVPRAARTLPGLLHALLDPDGAVLACSPELEAELGALPRTRGDILAPGRLRSDGLCRLRSGAPVRAILGPAPEGEHLILAPVDPDETTGAAPAEVLEGLPVALVALDGAGVVRRANAAARHLLGGGIGPGDRFDHLLEGLARPMQDRIADAIAGRFQGRAEIARGRLAGRDVFLQIAFTRMVEDGTPGILAVLNDATELKTLEAQFVQSQKMQAVGQLAGGVAHDFNNLLTAISGHCDLLLMRQEVGDADHADLTQIQQNAHRAAALVRQLLAFSRKQTLRPTTLDLRETLSDLAHLLNRLLGEKVSLRIEHAAVPLPVRADARQFEQVVMNLVVNARDAMPDGGEVVIETRPLAVDTEFERDRATVPTGSYAVVEVRDAGVGIPPEVLQKIFEPFYTTKRTGEGTGLGLSTAYGIVKQTGGFIFVTSTPGVGTAFEILLPVLDPVSETLAPRIEAAPPRDLTGQGVILLVEDEAPVRAFAARALKLRGYSVLEAGSSEEALDLLLDPTLHVDLFISDVVMPGRDGPSWIREAKETRPDVPVIFVSGYAEDSFNDDAPIAGATFLPKPFSLVDLTRKVKETLSP